jgi:hypothetical protein
MTKQESTENARNAKILLKKSDDHYKENLKEKVIKALKQNADERNNIRWGKNIFKSPNVTFGDLNDKLVQEAEDNIYNTYNSPKVTSGNLNEEIEKAGISLNSGRKALKPTPVRKTRSNISNIFNNISEAHNNRSKIPR